MKEREVILMNASGEDKPGLMAALMGVLSDHKAIVLDIGQAVIHNDLSIGVLFEIGQESDNSAVLKDLLFKAHKQNVHMKFTPISTQEYESWVSQAGKGRYIITLLSQEMTGALLSKITSVLVNQGLNIELIDRLSERMPLNNDTNIKSVVELTVRGTPQSVIDLKKLFMKTSKEQGVDIAFQVDNAYRRNRRLVCFDMDSTLIQTEVIDELARCAGVFDEVSAITEAAMRGELDFQESFIKRISLLKGLDESVMRKIAQELPITDGAERLMKTLRKAGYKTAILSGGFNYFGNYLKEKLGIDYVFSNELEIEEGKLTGRHIGDIVDGKKKAELLRLIAQQEGIHLEQTIAVGDGSNDLPMIKIAGLGIAFHAKPKVKESAKNSIDAIGLDALLYLIGFRDRDINEYTQNS
ncbi:MAG: phosphoserine phosphatase SerB [Mangrovibacterium sp.]